LVKSSVEHGYFPTNHDSARARALTGGDLGRQRQGWRLKSGAWAAGESATDPGDGGLGKYWDFMGLI